MSVDVLTVPDFHPPHLCRGLRAVYEAGLKNGRLKPADRGDRGTVIELSRVTSEPAVKDLPGRIAAALRSHFPGLPPLVLETAYYTRMVEGQSHPMHADAVLPDGRPNHTPNRLAAGMVYLTDSSKDHVGGLLRFPGLGIYVPMPTGLMVGFPSGWEHRHEVTVMESGTRDALAFWFVAPGAGAPQATAPKPAAKPATVATKLPRLTYTGDEIAGMSPDRLRSVLAEVLAAALPAGAAIADPHGYWWKGIESAVKMVELLPAVGLRPTAEQAARLEDLARRLSAVAKSA